jgi:predicted flap endonuclease-1-like 5' DNA nuclease
MRMNDGSDRPPEAPPPRSDGRNKGQSLVEAFRAARIAGRPALRTELRDNRLTLRHERTLRLRGAAHSATVEEAPRTAPDVATPATSAEGPPSQEGSPSIFATYCGTMQAASSPIEPMAPELQTPPPAEETIETAVPEDILPLSAIGFGPGMTIRMSQLGIETVSQLAVADREWLRTELGDLSQLVHVDVWIEAARKACAHH